MNYPAITIAGNLAGPPELRFTSGGHAVVNFTVAHTPRKFNRDTNQWVDDETLWVRCSAWREAAENIAESLDKGSRVLVHGNLKARSFETKEGQQRTNWELEVDEIGPSLRWATAHVARSQPGQAQSGYQQQPPQQGNTWGKQQQHQQGSPWQGQPESQFNNMTQGQQQTAWGGSGVPGQQDQNPPF